MIKLQIQLTSLDNRKFWIDKYDSITGNYHKALKTNDLERITKLVSKYNNLFKVIVCTCDGEIVKVYHRKKAW